MNRTSIDSISNPRLVRAILALRKGADPHRRGEVTRAVLSSKLLYEDGGRGLNRRTRSGLIEAFTDLESYHAWKAAPSSGYALMAMGAQDLFAWIIHARENGIVINPGGAATLKLRCEGSCAMMLGGRPIFWV